MLCDHCVVNSGFSDHMWRLSLVGEIPSHGLVGVLLNKRVLSQLKCSVVVLLSPLHYESSSNDMYISVSFYK